DGKTGEALWQFDTYSGIHSSPTVYHSDDDKIRIAITESYSTLYLLDKNGQPVIREEFSIPSGGITGLFASPLLSAKRNAIVASSWWEQDDVIYTVPFSSKTLTSKELDDGSKVLIISDDNHKRYIETQARVSATPVYYESRRGAKNFLLATEGGDLYTIDSEDASYDQGQAPGPVEAPLFLGDVNGDGEIEMLLATTTGKLYAYKLGLPAGGKRSLVFWPSFRGNRNNTGEASYTIDF
ncbi:MAG: hypothetical protein ACOCZ8_02060, partial [Bacteroidota bacterium]